MPLSKRPVARTSLAFEKADSAAREIEFMHGYAICR